MTTKIDAEQQIRPGAVSTTLQTDGTGTVVWGAAASSVDYVVMSDGAIPTPSPMDDGAGNFLYTSYTP